MVGFFGVSRPAPAAEDLTTLTTQQPGLTYCNPLPVTIADPWILKEGDRYYLYGTNATQSGFRVYTSTDLVNWTRGEMCYERQPGDWGQRDFWAPEVYKRGNTFYLFFSVKNVDAGIRNISIATADSPLGPFVVKKAPLLPGASFIDSHVFQDPTTGKNFFYVAVEDRTPNEIVGAPMSDDLMDLETTLTKVLGVSQPWENRWVEGPVVFERHGLYYLSYSGNAFWEPGYGVGVAVAKSPLGPYVKSEDNPLLRRTEDVHGPGHHCFVASSNPDAMFVFYHRHIAPGSRKRVLAMDVVDFKPGETSGPARLVLRSGITHTTQTVTFD